MNKYVILFLALMITLVQNLNAQVIEAWEPNEVNQFLFLKKAEKSPTLFSFFSDTAFKMIKIYQKDISTKSIQRCPFKTSCSHFAYEAIERKGFIGLCLFIDRYFYRENNNSFRKYKLIKEKNGFLKLDDDFYLN